MISEILLILSIAFQLGAMILAIQLIPITGKRSAWILVSLAAFLMTVRRIGSFIQVMITDVQLPFNWFIDLITLGISMSFFLGILLIKPLFVSRNHLIKNLEDALSQVQTLKGMIPICTSCKKIRDDHGYWLQVEQYISTHSSAEFSHSFCPDCLQKLYPDYCDDPNLPCIDKPVESDDPTGSSH
jgi:hypothetical protein